MVGAPEGHVPTYVSVRSAEVILSDIRPIKLKVDALHSVNALLDEFLFNILNAAQSLTTEKLKEGLLKVLPTALGKEALLEAEVELRAYWERTKPANSQAFSDNERQEFHLQWSFELLRLKCEAYSTLNDSDEDAEAERQLHDKMAHSGVHSSPRAALVAPAALYLTAILESTCEHILSNVGRVAARDSSRTSATAQDLFVALCEDETVYGLFKSMKAYEQIQNLSHLPKPRRSKSFSRISERASSVSRTDSTSKEISGHRDSITISRSRISSESPTAGPAPVAMSASRSSFEKARAMKMFLVNRSSSDHGSANGVEGQSVHKRSGSASSDATKQTLQDTQRPSGSIDSESEAMLEDFDNAMRSDPIMRMSLTPDRLKTMESFNKEKGNSRKSLKFSAQGSPKPSQTRPYDLSTMPPSPELPFKSNSVASPLRTVDSIDEDEEKENGSRLRIRVRQGSFAPRPTNKVHHATRTRSVSAANPPVTSHAPIAWKAPQDGVPSTPQRRERPIPTQLNTSATLPLKAGMMVRQEQPLDLEDQTGESDDDMALNTPRTTKNSLPRVSKHTQDLIDFLSSPPPEERLPATPASKSVISLENGRRKKGKLQKMISKLKLGESNGRQPSSSNSNMMDDSYLSRMNYTPTTSPIRPSLLDKKSTGSPGLANWPVPPRPPPVASLYSSTSQISLEDPHTSQPPPPLPQKVSTPTASPLHTPNLSKATSVQNGRDSRPTPSPPLVNGHASKDDVHTPASTPRASKSSVISNRPSSAAKRISETPSSSKRPSSRATLQANTISQPTIDAARDLRRLVAKATTADECRVLVDMFLARMGFPANPMDDSVVSAFPLPPASTPHSPLDDYHLEHSLVDLMLGARGDIIPYAWNHVIPDVPITLSNPPHTPDSDSASETGTSEDMEHIPNDTPVPAANQAQYI